MPKNKDKRVAVAMSGGVDSSLAAAQRRKDSMSSALHSGYGLRKNAARVSKRPAAVLSR